jgi:hypothetical protein
MKRSLLSFFLLPLALSALAQCSVSLSADTVTTYWGYEPLSCATITAIGDGVAPTTLVWSNGSTATSIQVCDSTSSWYSVVVTDDTLCTATDSVFVNVVDVRCGNNNNKVLVCHIPPGNPDNAHTICISANGVPAHLAHGCVLGACAPAPSDSLAGGGLVEIVISPNPVIVSGTIRVQSRASQQVTVYVVDATGRRLLMLLDAAMTDGDERVLTLDQSQLPEGTSMVWVEALGAEGRIARRVVLVQ